jgi:hypothetical protein
MPAEITKAEFIEQWGQGIISDPVGPIDGKVYGKRATTGDNPAEVVYAVV